jgi:small subunit ribosomal protein S11
MPLLKKKNKNKKFLTIGIANIKTTFNNTIITICDVSGNAICWASAGTNNIGQEKFSNAKKSTPYAAQIAAKKAAEKAIEFGLEKIDVVMKGRGNGRETSLRALKAAGLTILSVEDKTAIAHNGCRPPKRRRL